MERKEGRAAAPTQEEALRLHLEAAARESPAHVTRALVHVRNAVMAPHHRLYDQCKSSMAAVGENGVTLGELECRVRGLLGFSATSLASL